VDNRNEVSKLIVSNQVTKASKYQIVGLVNYIEELGLLAWPKRNEGEPVSGIGALQGRFEEVEIVGGHVEQSEASRSK
jgi:hypothetical protein